MKGYFFNAEPTSDIETYPSGYDREYDTVDYNLVMGTFFHNGVFANLNPDACKASSTGLTIHFTPGVVLINGGQGHLEPGDSVTLSQGDGKYSILCRKNDASQVRAFELVAPKDTDYPDPVREGDIYDLCLAHVLVSNGEATVTDTRGDKELCGFAAVAGQPPYQPSTGVPANMWDYTLFPEQMTQEDREIVENTPSLMELYRKSRMCIHTIPVGGIMMWSGAIPDIPAGWALCDGTNGTPDLRNKFIVGAGALYTVGNTGGAASVALSVAQMPSHRHRVMGAVNGGSYVPYLEISTRDPAALSTESYMENMLGYAGSNGSHENRPPYYALCFIMFKGVQP